MALLLDSCFTAVQREQSLQKHPAIKVMEFLIGAPWRGVLLLLLGHEGLMDYTRQKGERDKEAVFKCQRCGGLLEILWHVFISNPLWASVA